MVRFQMLLVALLVLAGLTFAACSGDDDDDDATATSTAEASGTATATATSNGSPSATSTASPQASATQAPAGSCSMYEQNVPPATYYGLLEPGDVVRVVNETCGLECGSFTTNDSGEWLLVVDRTSACFPQPGHVLAFYLNGELTSHSEIWTPGGTPENLITGIDLDGP